jgi:hypothetical protein
LFGASNQEVVWFDIAVNYSLFVHHLDTLGHLNGDQKYSFEVEGTLAGLEEVFEGGPEQVHDHDVELLVRDRVVRADVVESGNTG